MKCPKCQFEILEGLTFCGKCGAKLERICPKCNFSNPFDFTFCGKCGQDLSPPELVPKRTSSDEKPKRPSTQTIYHRLLEKRMKPWSALPNFSFICLFPIALIISFSKYGWSLYSVGFCLAWSSIPILLVIRYNSIEGEHRASRNTSIIVNILVFLLVSIGSTYNEFKKVTSPAKSVQREINLNIIDPREDAKADLGAGKEKSGIIWDEPIEKERTDARQGVNKIPEQQIQTESESRSERANYFFRQGNACLSTKRYTEAIDNYKKAILLNPNFAEAYACRGVAYYYQAQYDQAILDYTKALEINPDVEKALSLGYQIHTKFLEDLRKASGRQN